MLKFIIIVIAASVFGWYAYINFDEAFHDEPAYLKSQESKK
ncbi:MAG: hypothetical protein ACI9VM_000674 [Candidatus Azotimanducaceae bacterium]|jgi:hypothetical protein